MPPRNRNGIEVSVYDATRQYLEEHGEELKEAGLTVPEE